jgi:hypothetical protein
MADTVQLAVERMVKNAPRISQRVKVVISRIGSVWIADLDLRLGSRRLEGNSCGALTETMAVVIALAVEQREPSASNPTNATAAAAAAAPPAAAPAATAPTTPGNVEHAPATPSSNEKARVSQDALEREPVVVAPPPTPQKTRQPPVDTATHFSAPQHRDWKWGTINWSVSVGALGEIGALPHAAAAGTIGLRIAGPAWALRARWAAFFSQDAVNANRQVGSIAFGVGTLEPCVALRLADRWEACASFEYGSMSGTGEDTLARGSRGRTAWYALGSNVGWWIQLANHLYLEPRLGVALPLFHPAFEVNQSAVHRVGIVSGRAELNFWLQF